MGTFRSRATYNHTNVKYKVTTLHARPRAISFRHIQIKPTPKQENCFDHEKEPDFVYKESMQREIEARLTNDFSNSQSLVCFAESSKTFAEATISTPYHAQITPYIKVRDVSEMQVTLNRCGLLSAILKKRKSCVECDPFKVSPVEPVHDGESTISSPVATIAPSTSQHESALNTEFSPQIPNTYLMTPISVVSPQFDPNVPKSLFDLALAGKPKATGTTALNRLDDHKILAEDLTIAMDRFRIEYQSRNIPAKNDDWFDSLEWNSNVLATTALDNSPEPLTITPQKIAYTTVGSLVDPNSAPRFTAPNRIQRERSVSERTSYGSSSYHSSESRYQPNDPSTLQNTTAYTQRNLQNTNLSLRKFQSRDSTSVVSSTHRRVSVNHPSTPSKFQPRTPLQMQSRNMQFPLGTPALIKQFLGKSDHGLADNTEKELGTSGGIYCTGNDRATENTNYLISTFHDIIQENITNFECNTQKLLPIIDNKSDALKPIIPNMTRNNISLVKGERENHDTTSYGTNSQPTDTMNSLSIYPECQCSKASRSTIDSNKPLGHGQVSGYPQPLTAGPPGGRQYKHGLSTYPNSCTTSTPTSYPFTNNIQGQGLAIDLPTHEVVDKKRASDTLPISLASKYFPFGLPGDMNGKFKPLSAGIQKRMEQLSVENFELHERNASLKKAMETDEWFYSGQRQLFMTADDYVNGMEKIHKAGQPLSVDGLLEPLNRSTERRLLTLEELNRMTIADSAAPILDVAFGTLLNYAYRGPLSVRSLSNYRPAVSHQIDSTEGGNSSFFY